MVGGAHDAVDGRVPAREVGHRPGIEHAIVRQDGRVVVVRVVWTLGHSTHPVGHLAQLFGLKERAGGFYRIMIVV